MQALRFAAGAASWLGPACLAVLHGLLLYGVFQGHPAALSTASYLENWAVAEVVSLFVTPYLLLLTVPDHEKPRWERAIWLPGILLAMGGIGGSLRLLQATWVYVLARIPIVLAGRATTGEANLGCLRSVVGVVVLVVLAGVFANRPSQWPIGTLVGSSLSPEGRYLANMMAFATAYFAVTAGIDGLIRREVRRSGVPSFD